MKLGVTYNVWEDAIEHLPISIRLIKPYVDYINIVYQKKSNTGYYIKDANYINIVNSLFNKNIVDSIIEFEPYLGALPSVNEVNKRHIGMCDLIDNGKCTHFITMDSDEFYVPNEFIIAKSMVDKYDVLSSTCPIQSYYYSYRYKLSHIDNYQVPFIYKVRDGITFEHSGIIEGYTCDPTRVLQKLDSSRHLHLPTLTMHHMTYVRQNLSSKLYSSSASINYSGDLVKTCVAFYDNFAMTDKKKGLIIELDKLKFVDLVEISKDESKLFLA